MKNYRAPDTLVDFHTGDVYKSFNCDGQGRDYNIMVPTPTPQWVNPTSVGAYQAFEMLPRHTYLPPEITCGDNGGSRDYDYNNLPGGECVASDGGIGACTTIPDGPGDLQQACAAKCDETTPGWIAINFYGTEDAAGIDCCCQTSCDCSQPSTNGDGVVITQNVANLPTSFCPDGRVVMSGTCKRRRKYTQYHGIRLGDILGMMVVDMIIFSLLAYYFSQVWPSEFGVRKHWCFCLPCLRGGGAKAEDEPGDRDVEDREGASGEEVVVERDHRTDAPTVTIKGLRKVFGSFVAVDDLGFDMHANEIFSLLGHNGAGKTTSINVLTGILASDSREADGGATIFGHPIKTDLDGARSVIGVCPQHNVLFELLTTREHLTFFARLKGSTDADAEEEADQLLDQFHLSERGNHRGHELSGGMKRKLSTAVALCGRSKFVLLDEPTAGMDALARRELWDLLAGAKKDRTVLLTTHYMDEADVLGDRIGIMSHGKLRCVGSSRFLKAHYGAGYRVVCEKAADFDEQASLRGFDDLLKEKMPGGERAETLAKRKIAEPTFEATLPLDARDKFGDFFHALDERKDLIIGAPDTLVDFHTGKDGLKIAGYGLTITTLEEVFLAVGGDETVAPKEVEGELAIGAGRKYQASFPVQVMGLAKKRLHIAPNDCKTILLILFPLVGCVAGFALAIGNTLSSNNENQDFGTFAIACLAGTLLVPPLLAENVVRERETKLRDVLAVMGCDFRAYWLGTFLGDSILLAIAWFLGYWIFVPATGVSRYLNNGGTFWWPPMCISYIIVYSYALSILFSKSKRCLIFGTGIQILQLYIGLFIVLIIYLACSCIGESKLQGRAYWVSPAFSPQTMFFMGMYAVVRKPGAYGGPRYVWQVILYLVVFACFYVFIIYSRELVHERPLAVVMPDADVAATAEGDADVVKEREAVNAMTDISPGGPYTLVAKHLRKVYPPKGSKKVETVAVHDCSFRVGKGECFGLLGANGAGKTTTMDMIIRAQQPTAGDAFVDGHSTQTSFHKAAEALGVVAQANTLWDKLSCEDHLKLFARIRGVPGKETYQLVETALDQLELRPHAKKLAERLSGGMKRKLCVAIAIVGDPQCVLLDEPSAGLDPVSRRNLWNVIRATMDTRSVVLTSHLMEEVEALCDRVGIMVKGKLRCLGTIQHLKSSLGKHYEVELAVDPEKFAADPDTASTKVRALAKDVFPGCEEEGPPNAGLFTYRVPQESIKIGDVFDQVQARKDEVDLVDYSIAQPSLEAVFIRTVLDYSGEERPDLPDATGQHRASVRELSKSVDSTEGLNEAVDEALKKKKWIGCTRKWHYIIAVVCLVIGLVSFFLAGIVNALFVVAIIFWLISIVGCVGCCCMLKKDKYEDDGVTCSDTGDACMCWFCEP